VTTSIILLNISHGIFFRNSPLMYEHTSFKRHEGEYSDKQCNLGEGV